MKRQILLFRRITHEDGAVRKELMENPKVQKVWHKKGYGFYCHLLSSKEWMSISEIRDAVIKYSEDFPLDCDSIESNGSTILTALGELVKVSCVAAKYEV
jgi:hypothetical protein